MYNNCDNKTIHFSVDIDIDELRNHSVFLNCNNHYRSRRFFVGIVGDTSDFGNWNPQRGMVCKSELIKSNTSEVWGCIVAVDRLNPCLKYRYYIGEYASGYASSSDKKFVLLAWESRLRPRTFCPSDLLSVSDEERLSVKFGAYDDGNFIQRGHLISHTELRIRLTGHALKLARNAVPGLSASTCDLTHLSGRRIYVACRKSDLEEDYEKNDLEVEPPIYPNSNPSSILSKNSGAYNATGIVGVSSSFEMGHSEGPASTNTQLHSETGTSPHMRFMLQPDLFPLSLQSSGATYHALGSLTSLSARNKENLPVLLAAIADDRSRPHIGEHTGCYGTLYTFGEDITFFVDVVNLEDTAVEIEFYLEAIRSLDASDKEDNILPPVKFLGAANFGPFENYFGHKRGQLLSRRKTPMGEVRISYLVINPLMRGPPPSLEVSYRQYWKNRAAIDIGHRGMGTYYIPSNSKLTQRPADHKENTLGAFKAAVHHGADFIEMDVQLTKDLQVVVYHDFEAVIAPRKKRRGELQYLEVAVKDLPYSAFRDLKTQHTSVLSETHTNEEMQADDLDPIELQHFPLLRECLEHLDPDVGFDIEIKYPMELREKGSEMENFFERNLYVDVILKEIFTFAASRRILLSCFDPDTCAMLQMKQIKYPVFQLGTCAEYIDYRQSSFQSLCHAAVCNQLLGVAVNSKEIIDRPDLVEFVRSLGLIVLVWGAELNCPDLKARITKMGVHGLIFDRMQEHKESGTMSVFKSARLTQEESSSTNISTTSCTSALSTRAQSQSDDGSLSQDAVVAAVSEQLKSSVSIEKDNGSSEINQNHHSIDSTQEDSDTSSSFSITAADASLRQSPQPPVITISSAEEQVDSTSLLNGFVGNSPSVKLA